MKALSFLLAAVLVFSGRTHFQPARSRLSVVLEGAWQSCPDNDDESYGERIYSQYGPDGPYEIHLGPRDEFSVFPFRTTDDLAHDDGRNLLGPAFHYSDVDTVAGGRNWYIPRLQLHLNIVRVPGSWENCYAFFILAEPDRRKSANR